MRWSVYEKSMGTQAVRERRFFSVYGAYLAQKIAAYEGQHGVVPDDLLRCFIAEARAVAESTERVQVHMSAVADEVE